MHIEFYSREKAKSDNEDTDMLLLTRRIGETIVIGDNIRVTVVGVNGRQVKLGIEAPREIEVDRAEIRERKDKSRVA